MQRSLAYLRDDGWTADKAEQWIPRANIRKDLFGVADIVAVKLGERPMLVQTTDGTSFARHRDKILDSPHLPVLLDSFRIVLHGWRRVKLKRGGKAVKWELRQAEFSARDLNLQPAEART